MDRCRLDGETEVVSTSRRSPFDSAGSRAMIAARDRPL